MRENIAAMSAASKAAAASRHDAPTRLVCVALVLSVVMLASRIFSVW
jgi:hypothetical protein